MDFNFKEVEGVYTTDVDSESPAIPIAEQWLIGSNSEIHFIIQNFCTLKFRRPKICESLTITNI